MRTIAIFSACLASLIHAHQNSRRTGDVVPSFSSVLDWAQFSSDGRGAAASPLKSLAAILLAFGHPTPGQRPAFARSSLQRSPPVHLAGFEAYAAGGVAAGPNPFATDLDASVKQRELALLKWLSENGVYTSDKAGFLEPPHPLRVESDTMEDFERSGRGLIARAGVTQGAPILKVPTKLIMRKATAIEQLGPRVIPDSLGEYLSIAMLLMHERSLGAASFYAPYINILPSAEEVGQTWVWEEDELALLTGSAVINSTVSLRNKLYSDFELLTRMIIEPNRLDETVFCWEGFKWAMSMLFSRAINLKESDELGMVPYADLVNHSPYVTSYFMYNAVPLSPDREVVLYADRNYAINDQVLISYGQKSNAELILLYGFVCDGNIFDQVEITVGLAEDDPRYEEKANYLKYQGLKTEQTFPMLLDRFSDELLQYMRLCAMSNDVRAELDAFRYNTMITLDNEITVFEALKAGCLALLDNYPETEDDDRSLMENVRMFAALPRNARMAIKLRRNEKRILLRTIQVCNTRLELLRNGQYWE